MKKEKIIDTKASFKNKIIDAFGFLLFLLMFIGALPVLIITGGLLRPIRYFKYVSSEVNNKTKQKYYY